MGEVLHGLLHPPTKKVGESCELKNTPCHPELVSGSIRGTAR